MLPRTLLPDIGIDLLGVIRALLNRHSIVLGLLDHLEGSPPSLEAGPSGDRGPPYSARMSNRATPASSLERPVARVPRLHMEKWLYLFQGCAAGSHKERVVTATDRPTRARVATSWGRSAAACPLRGHAPRDGLAVPSSYDARAASKNAETAAPSTRGLGASSRS